ncbi:MAG: PorT family protein, partial [Cyclobacteriaceae bacterium]|nr:PorT family protein [Cyclobacteriaceae bacterium]
MSKLFFKFYGCTILCLALQVQSMGQGACTETLDQAQDEFEEGHLYIIPSILKDCLAKGFTKQERIQAYWLLTRTYLVIDDPISAENSYLELLKLDPEYNIDEENDPIEIVYLSKKYKTTPIFEFTFFKAGVNYSKPLIIQEYSLPNTQENYSSGWRYQMGPAAAFNINDDFSLNMEVLFSLKSYSSFSLLFPDDSLKNVDELHFNEKQAWIDIPLYVRYEKTYGKWSPYVYGGYSFNFLLSAKATATFVNIEPSGKKSTEVNDKSIYD